MLLMQLHLKQWALVDHPGAIVLVLLAFSDQGTKRRYKPSITNFSVFIMSLPV
jgi:hypothetical protein